MDNIIEKKSYDFAIRTVKLCSKLDDEKTPRVLTNQILKSGTSIGANISEAQHAQSKKDFIAKIHIALKETAETKYWLRLFYDTGFLNEKEFNSMFSDAVELKKLLLQFQKLRKRIQINLLSERSE